MDQFLLYSILPKSIQLIKKPLNFSEQENKH